MLLVADLSRTGLQPASFVVSPGECVAVRGPSGAGKTLLLRAVADLDPAEGRVELDGVDRDAVPAPQWRRKVVYMPAEPGWWADTVGEHFADWAGISPLLPKVGLPDEARGWPVARCSTGERLRLALVRALALNPRVILLDEPTAALDAASVSAVEGLVRERLGTGMSALWVTHDDVQAGRVARRTLTIDGGVVQEAVLP